MFTCCHIYFRFLLPLIFIYITCVLLSLCRTSAHIHLTTVLGVLGTQETSCILISGGSGGGSGPRGQGGGGRPPGGEALAAAQSAAGHWDVAIAEALEARRMAPVQMNE